MREVKFEFDGEVEETSGQGRGSNHAKGFESGKGGR